MPDGASAVFAAGGGAREAFRGAWPTGATAAAAAGAQFRPHTFAHGTRRMPSEKNAHLRARGRGVVRAAAPRRPPACPMGGSRRSRCASTTTTRRAAHRNGSGPRAEGVLRRRRQRTPPTSCRNSARAELSSDLRELEKESCTQGKRWTRSSSSATTCTDATVDRRYGCRDAHRVVVRALLQQHGVAEAPSSRPETRETVRRGARVDGGQTASPGRDAQRAHPRADAR